MKKILFVTESLAMGGMEQMQVTLANSLSDRGYDVTVLCIDPRDSLRSELRQNVRYIYKPQRTFPVMSRLPYIHRFYKTKKYMWEKRAAAKKLYKYYVGKEKYDVEIAFIRGAPVKIVSGSTNKKSLKLVWVHTDFKLCNQKSIIGWFNDKDETVQAYGKFDKICCVSDRARASFGDVIGLYDKTVTVYNMISVKNIIEKSNEQFLVKKDRFTIVTVGRLIRDKRVDRLLQAAKRLTDEGYSFNLWIVGDGVIADELKKYVKDEKLENVTFFGMQKNPYVYMKNADVFVLSSQREGFALVVPEAMSCGLPVIATDCAGPAEILDNGKYGIIIDNNDESVYRILKQILDNPSMLDCFKNKSEGRASYFDAGNMVKRVIDIIE